MKRFLCTKPQTITTRGLVNDRSRKHSNNLKVFSNSSGFWVEASMKNQTLFPEDDEGDEEEEAWRSKVSGNVLLVSSEKSGSMKRTGSGSKLDGPNRRRINSFSFDRIKNFSFEMTTISIFLGVGVGQEEDDVIDGRNLSIERGEEIGEEGGDGEADEKAEREANKKLCG